jgi:hypothetical protein
MFKRIGKRHSQDFVVAVRLQRPRVPVVGGGVAADGLALLDRDLSDRAANAMKSVDGFPSTRACTPAEYPRAIRQGRALPRMRIRLRCWEGGGAERGSAPPCSSKARSPGQ